MTAAPAAYAARVVSVRDALPDTRILCVETEGRQRLAFRAGQYMTLAAEGEEPRAFSIASAPGEPLLEFHIRDTGQGFSALAMTLKPGSPLTLRGPLGRGARREDGAPQRNGGAAQRNGGAPLLLLAGGIGIAPMKAIIGDHLSRRDAAPAHLYWGAHRRERLYLDAHFRALAVKHARFSYIPVLSEGADAGFRHGMIGPALEADFETLHGTDIYIAGPKAMILSVLPVLERLGAEKDSIFSDAFSV